MATAASDVPTVEVDKEHSVIPSVLATRDAQGWKLKEHQATRTKTLTVIVISIIVTLAAAWFTNRAFSSFMALETEQLTDEVESMFLGGIVFLCALFYVFRTIQQFRLNNVVGPAEVIIEQLPLRLNQPYRIQYHRKLHESLDITKIEAKLTCTEYVRFRRGTDMVNESTEVWQQELPFHMSPSGYHGDINLNWTITIPADKPSSFEASHNLIEWAIVVNAEIAGHADANVRFLVPVLPEVLHD